MSIETDIFIKRRPRFELFGPYGFVEIGGIYIYECDFMGNDFRCRIEVDKNGSISGNVIDAITDEEYLPLRVEVRGCAFTNMVRHEYEKILLNIANSCYAEVPFESYQANSITDRIYNKYNERPDFPWNSSGDKSSGIFRHTENNKWYALIMNIKMSLLDSTSNSQSFVDVINVKIDSCDGEMLRSECGIYNAYHMNKKHWISVVLDGTFQDERVMELLDKSYFLTKRKSKKASVT